MSQGASPTDRPPLDPPVEEMRRLGYRAVDLIVEHLHQLGAKPVLRTGAAEELLPLVDEPLPERGHDLEACLDRFARSVLPRMTLVNHPRFHAYIPCPGSFAATLGTILDAGTNPFTGSWLGGGSLAALEVVVLRWVAEAVGFHTAGTGMAAPAGILTSGGSIANLIGLAAARCRAGDQAWPRGTIYVSAEAHASVAKAARILGLPEPNLRRIAVDPEFRLRVTDLAAAMKADRRAGLVPIAVCGSAGTTNTGAIDPLGEIADLCADLGVWFHVDGAYGGFAAVAPEGRRLLSDLGAADSLTLDPHKWLYSGMGTGCVLVRDRQALEQAFSSHAAYMRDIPTDEVNFHERGPELSRPGRVLGLWMVLRSIGRRRLAEQIAHDLRLARLAARAIVEAGVFELVCPPQLSVVVFRHRLRAGESRAERATRDSTLMRRVMADGSTMISSTEIGGAVALRLVVMNHRTTEAELRRTLDTLHRLSTP